MTDRYTIKISREQKETLSLLREKYRINPSSFIREAIHEKLNKDRVGILRNYKDVQKHLDKMDECPF